MEKGLIQVYTGNGKGKSTAATGQIIRAIGRGYRVIMVYWLKEKEISGEMNILEKLGVQTFFWGTHYGQALIANRPLENLSQIKKESKYFLKKIKEKIKKEKYDLLVLDEINIAVDYGLVEEKELLQLSFSQSLGEIIGW